MAKRTVSAEYLEVVAWILDVALGPLVLVGVSLGTLLTEGPRKAKK